jgi:hypothetical protein
MREGSPWPTNRAFSKSFKLSKTIGRHFYRGQSRTKIKPGNMKIFWRS